METEEPEISVLVPARMAIETVAQTMGQLLDRKGLEVVAVVSSDDPTASVLRAVKARYPELVLVEVEGNCSVPQLRAHGIRRTRGRLVALTEDHCSFSASWPAALAPPLDDSKVGAVGGGVVNGRRDSLLDWAIFFSRYASSMPPVERGAAGALPGANACYRREVLQSLAFLYEEGFWENDFHDELRRRGMQLWLEPDALVAHNKPYLFSSYCALRFCHARCFAGRIRRRLGFFPRQGRILLSPLTPLLLAIRSARAVASKGKHRWEYFFSLPILLVFYVAWSVGELTGYLLGPGESCSQTD